MYLQNKKKMHLPTCLYYKNDIILCFMFYIIFLDDIVIEDDNDNFLTMITVPNFFKVISRPCIIEAKRFGIGKKSKGYPIKY